LLINNFLALVVPLSLQRVRRLQSDEISLLLINSLKRCDLTPPGLKDKIKGLLSAIEAEPGQNLLLDEAV
jgi:hypothetical protein